jgi:hypothetical protein
MILLLAAFAACPFARHQLPRKEYVMSEIPMAFPIPVTANKHAA